MSELKTNKITPATGTNVVMGDSGDSFSLAAGATATGFGTEIVKQSSDPTTSVPATPTLGDMILNTTTGKLFVCTTVASGANVWQAGVDGTVEPFTGMVATGGTETTDGDYKVHSFNSSGTFEVTTAGTTPQVEYLVIAGGGGGGGNISGGGGGAGGYLTATGFSVSTQTYAITVGAGGAAHANGANSVFSTITSTGGGYGAAYNGGAGTTGGSGGGSGGSSTRSAAGTGISGQGFAGGIGDQVPARCGGGGGGASEVGSDAVATNILGQGGDGLSSSITGSAITRGGGGTGASNESGGAAPSPVAGGAGGGGSGGNAGTASTAGTVNTGGGGGGGTTGAGQAGGSGIVIIRYKFQ